MDHNTNEAVDQGEYTMSKGNIVFWGLALGLMAAMADYFFIAGGFY